MREMYECNKPTVTQRMEAFGEFIKEQRAILLGKGHDYTAGQAEKDAYANFRIVADLLDGAPITPYTVCMIYFLKHAFSLVTFTKTGMQESGEGLRGRHLDVADYAFILDQLMPDHLNYFIDKRYKTINKAFSDAGRPEIIEEFSRPIEATKEGGDTCIIDCNQCDGNKGAAPGSMYALDQGDFATSTLNSKED